MAKNLPLGLQDFRKIIENDFLYVDKTEYLFRIAEKPGAYFLSRPRRFGKSLTISTLYELYRGSRELFEGLWIADRWDWKKIHPVIRLSLKDVNFEQRGLEEPLAERLDEMGQWHGISLKSISARDKLRELIIALANHGKVVVLVDEYDAPIIHYLGREQETAYRNRDLLRGFYSVLKEMDTLLELVFLTGVSKFSKTGIFSGLNNLVDLTMHPDYATMLGYTQKELESNFEQEIEAAANQMNLSREDLLNQMQEWYNGYRFEENAETIYNPNSIMNFLDRRDFQYFWFSTGTPSFLVKLLRKQQIQQFNPATPCILGLDSYESEEINVHSLLYQTGYLTIQSRDEFGLYHLNYPNREVKTAFMALLPNTVCL